MCFIDIILNIYINDKEKNFAFSIVHEKWKPKVQFNVILKKVSNFAPKNKNFGLLIPSDGP